MRAAELRATRERAHASRAATLLAGLLAPLFVLWLVNHGRSLAYAILFGIVLVAAFRGTVDLALKQLVEPRELTLDSPEEDMREDALSRRRAYFWSRKLRLASILGLLVTVTWALRGGTWTGTVAWMWGGVTMLGNPQILMQLIILPIFFLANFLLFFGPMMLMGISQMRGLEPGDADFGVRIEDVRGQAEAKAEVRKIVTLWQSGSRFIASGGKRERGVLFLGPPGTGKTMLAKAIATGFNSPIVLMPGSGFAQTFIGMDVIIVRWMTRKARKLAAKWGGSAIVFIDEIDAVGMRRAALGGAGGMGHGHRQIPGGFMGGMGQMGLQSLLVVMDGIDNPPLLRRLLVSKINLYLDVLYLVPQRLGRYPLRLPRARPTGNQIFFVGATNVPLEMLDPALTRPGRMGRHVYFRSPTKRDRADILDLYLGKVAHEGALDGPPAREELARLTDGYSPAQIEQVCSLALSYAYHSGRDFFLRADFLEAMVTVEVGTAMGWGYESEEEERSTAVHEAGHAVCMHIYEPHKEAARLSVRKRGQTGGHLQPVETIERFAYSREELYGDLITGLGAYAAEYVFYGHNTQGVTGDLRGASLLAGRMVGHWGMAPLLLEVENEALRRKIGLRIERIGRTLLAASMPGDIALREYKERNEAMILGRAFVVAYNAVRTNRAAIDIIVDVLLREKEVYGDDLQHLLDSCGIVAPTIDWGDAHTYPALVP